MEEQTFKDLKAQGFYVIRTDDGDRYLWEVYANNELDSIVGSSEEAYCRLGELVEMNLADNEE